MSMALMPIPLSVSVNTSRTCARVAGSTAAVNVTEPWLVNFTALSARFSSAARNRIKRTGRLRLSVFRSLKHIYAQIIDDEKGVTLVSASSLALKLKGNKTEVARQVGRALAEKALALGIKQVAFDRGPYKYHGRVKALAEGAREGGLEF